LAGSNKNFVWISLAHVYGIPGTPEWAGWFSEQLKTYHAMSQLLGIGCDPVLVKGTKEQFLDWLRWAVESGAIRLPVETGTIHWPRLSFQDIFVAPLAKAHVS
jgi:hypothetical protein